MRKIYHIILKYLKVYQILENQETIKRNQSEIIKALVFNSTIIDSEWLKYKSFSPGEWAVDYGFLYTLYRVLNEMRPNKILEFGLGQSSKMLHQYGAFFNQSVTTCEHNQSWIDFFLKQIDNKYKVNINRHELIEIEYKGCRTLTYQGIEERYGNDIFDLIIVDGPYGSKHFSRSQIIYLAQKCLDNRFCIIIDDYNRIGERETAEEIKKIFSQNNIDFCCRTYVASKEHLLLCSNDLDFLTTL